MIAGDEARLLWAKRWLDAVGEEAVPRAVAMAEMMRRLDNNAGADEWLRIIAAVEELRADQTRMAWRVIEGGRKT